jgi:hypothetical protein
MTNVIDLASVVVVLMAIVAAGAALVSTRHRGAALPILLDLLTAAGLLHLSAGPSFGRALTAAAVLAVRTLIRWGLSDKGGQSMPPGMPPGMPGAKRGAGPGDGRENPPGLPQ